MKYYWPRWTPTQYFNVSRKKSRQVIIMDFIETAIEGNNKSYFTCGRGEWSIFILEMHLRSSFDLVLLFISCTCFLCTYISCVYVFITAWLTSFNRSLNSFIILYRELLNMALKLRNKPSRISFLIETGIPEIESETYTKLFVENRIAEWTVLSLIPENLDTLGVTVLGDKLAILTHVRSVLPATQDSSVTSALQSHQLFQAPHLSLLQHLWNYLAPMQTWLTHSTVNLWPIGISTSVWPVFWYNRYPAISTVLVMKQFKTVLLILIATSLRWAKLQCLKPSSK